MIRHGGARVGCGRKRKPRAICSCGRTVKTVGATKCRDCGRQTQRGVIRSPERPCTYCARPFRSVRGRRCCSDVCRRARLAELYERLRTGDPVKRARRRRASAKRREHIYSTTGSRKDQVGRWRRIGDRDSWVCWLCCRAVDPTVKAPRRWAPSVDHVVALSRGGSDLDQNLRLAHFGCNSRRGAGRFGGRIAA